MERRILIVEDSLTQAQALHALIEDAGYEVSLARSAEDALQQVAPDRFDLVLSDVVMPGMNGYELCRHIKGEAELRDLPVVLLTSLNDPMDIVHGLECGADNYITKPYDPAHLLARIRRVLDNQHLRRNTRTSMGVNIAFLGSTFTITSEREQILDLLLSSVEDVVRTNRALQESQRELAGVYSQLEAYAREKAQEAEVSTEKYRALMQNAGDAIFVAGRDGRIREANARAADLLGRAAAELPGECLEDFVVHEERPHFRERLPRLGTSPDETPSEWQVLTGGGRVVHCEISASLSAVSGEDLLLVIVRDITSRKDAEAAIRAQRAYLRAVVDAGPNLIFAKDQAGRYVLVNRALAELYGTTADELLGRTDADFHPDPEMVERFRREDREVLETGRGRVIPEDRVTQLSTGETRWFETRKVRLVPPGGGDPQVLGIASDITARKKAEHALKRSEARMSGIISIAADAIISLDEQQRIILFNEGAEQVFGYTRDEAVGRPADFLFPDVDRARHRAYLAEFLRGNPASRQMGGRGGVRGLRKNGEEFPAEASLSRLSVDGEVILTAMVRDISERRQAEEELRESNQRLQALISASPIAILTTDVELNVTRWSPAAERVFGYAEPEVIGRRLPVIPPEAETECRELLGRVLAGHGSTDVEVRRRRKDATMVDVSLSTAPLRDGTGAIVGILGLYVDISERKAAEQALAHSEELLRQAQKMEAVGRLAGGIAHDFNNMLTAIKGNAEMVLLDLEPEHPSRPDLLEVQRAADRAAGLTRQLLAFSRKQVLQPTILDLNAVIDSTEKMLRRLIGEDVELQTLPCAGLPRIRADRGQIEQVIMNLAVNARDAMASGGTLTLATRSVEVAQDEVPFGEDVAAGPYVVLSVSDTGTGMDEETRAHIFEPFFTTKEQGKGTGLGLSTVYGIVRQSGGWIDVESAPGEGTEFLVYFPVAYGRGEEPHPPHPPPRERRGSETILLVEDEPAVRALATKMLTRQGYEVLEASGGTEALRIARGVTGPVHLLITDVVMPKISGREVAEQVRALHPETRVLYMSGYTNETIVHHGVLDEGIELLEKPFSPADLARRARGVLDA